MNPVSHFDDPDAGVWGCVSDAGDVFWLHLQPFGKIARDSVAALIYGARNVFRHPKFNQKIHLILQANVNLQELLSVLYPITRKIQLHANFVILMRMKILVISDSHGHIANLKAVMEIGKKAGVAAVVHCGDWDNKESIEAVLLFDIPLYTVLGNADVEEGLEEYLKFNTKGFDPFFLKINLDGRKIGIIHKVKKDDARFDSLDVVFSGHYHSGEVKMINFTKFVRPGAIINGINFAIYQTETNEVQFIKES